MKSLLYQTESSPHFECPRAGLEPVQSDHPLRDGGWWPDPSDLDRQLRLLIPVLDPVRGLVKRLVLSAEAWTGCPHRIVMDARTVSVDYQAGRSPWMITVICADGGTFTIRMVPPGPAPGALSDLGTDLGKRICEADVSVFGSLRRRVVR